MCGIAGFVGEGLTQAILEEKIKEACQFLKHRGPDEFGIAIENGVALGVSRLAIRDPLKGQQPITTNDMTPGNRPGLKMVFNGELYGSEFLKTELENQGYSFSTEGDTEVLFNAYLHYGEAIFEQLTGMFACALWDSQTQTLTLCRDRWGEKPLYFAYNDSCMAFASEIKALKVWPFISWEVSTEDISIFLRHSYLPAPRTGWTNIHKLEPGCLLKWKGGQWSQQRYFNLSSSAVQSSKPLASQLDQKLDRPQQLFKLLDQSVKSCLVSDKPVGAFLSGGIDSTTIVTLMARHQQNFPVFSMDWKETSHSEGTYIQQVVDTLHLNHFKMVCDAAFFKDHFEQVVKMFDEPFGDESMIPTFCLAKAAKNHVSVVLTGDGSDEFFHGYERYFYKGTFANYINVFSALPQKTKEKIFSKDFLKASSDEDGFLLARYSQAETEVCEKRRRSWTDIQTYLPDDILTKVDRMTMSVGLEARAPFLTPAVTDFALGCCMQDLSGGKERGKEILRAAMKDYLPQSILERKKMGFGVPLKEWFCLSLREWMEERLLSGCLFSTGWFSREEVEGLIDEHVTQVANHSRIIFNLLVLETWLRSQCR